MKKGIIGVYIAGHAVYGDAMKRLKAIESIELQYTPEDFQKIVELSNSTGNDIEDIHRWI